MKTQLQPGETMLGKSEARSCLSNVLEKIDTFFEKIKRGVSARDARRELFPCVATTWEDEPFKAYLLVVKPQLEFMLGKLKEEQK